MEVVEIELRSQVVAPSRVALMWLEQSHFAFKTPWGLLLHVDPFLSRAVSPEKHIRPEPLIPPDRAPADYVFLTHDHRDHTDPHTLGPMARSSPACRFFGPRESCDRLLGLGLDPGRVLEVVEGETVRLNGFSATVVYAENTSARDATTHLGYIFDFGGVRIYHTGDTRKDPQDYLGRLGTVRALRPDVLILPINLGYNNPGSEGAARIVEHVDPRLVIPCHYDCFLHNTADPADFIRALPPERRGSVRILEPGKFFLP